MYSKLQRLDGLLYHWKGKIHNATFWQCAKSCTFLRFLALGVEQLTRDRRQSPDYCRLVTSDSDLVRLVTTMNFVDALY